MIAICIATCRRPEGLQRLLRALEQLEFQTPNVPSVCVIVVDNDPHDGESIAAAENFSNFRWQLKLLAEERRGISFARNRALQEALRLRADAIAFIDDDEVPDPGWLEGLLQVQKSSGVEAVTGPILPRFEHAVPKWIINGGFFDRPRFPTGTPVAEARTGNLLLVAKTLEDSGLRFNEEFGLSGGEDTLLTLQLRRRGARIVWADQSVVREWIPPDRANSRYLLRRAFAGGNNWARVERLLDPRLRTVFKRSAIAAARIAQGALLLLPSTVIGRHAVVKNAARACLGMGMLAGVFESSFHLYGSPERCG